MSGYNKQTIRLRLNSNIKPCVSVMQYDNGRELHFLFDDFLLDSNITEARIYVLKPSGHEIYNPCRIVDSEVVVKSTTQMLAECGRNIGAIQLIYSENISDKITSFPFIMEVEKNIADDSAIESKDEFKILDVLITDARKLIADVETAEKIRESAEKERIKNEDARKSAEIVRDNAEKTRNTNETNRKSAEAKRQTDTKAAINNCETATGKANTATTTANQAASNADSKAQLANTAATNANNKASVANNAATNANNKAQLANEAADAAKDAESKALAATTKANTAATNADDKATLANTAATNANDKASLANTAATNANAAADRANEIADDLEGLSGALINDDKATTNTTYSSQKISELLSSVVKIGKTEPVGQMVGGIWLIEG